MITEDQKVNAVMAKLDGLECHYYVHYGRTGNGYGGAHCSKQASVIAQELFRAWYLCFPCFQTSMYHWSTKTKFYDFQGKLLYEKN